MDKQLKLYSMVWVSIASPFVSNGKYQFVGQVLSRRTPEGTYMVRRVPGHAGTLEEIPEAHLEPAEGRFTHVSFVAVRGRGTFPVDMLRYDNCAPVNFTIEDTDSGPKAVLMPGMGDELIVAKACGTFKPARWTIERWNSFLWGLKDLGEHRIDGLDS